ncbi:MAG: hypothetical protein AB7O67_09890 [Vicinamibacterales bacterium]
MRGQMDVRRHAGSLALAAAATALLVSTALSAQGGGQGGPPTPSEPLVPVTASSVVRFPDRYEGKPVTLTATVESSLSPMMFTVDQDPTKATGEEVLVLPRNMNAPVKPNAYVTVIGELVKYDAAEIAKKDNGLFKPDLPADVAAKYAGKPVVLATSVIQAGDDLAMRLPPPMVPGEQAVADAMKKVGPANAAIRKAIEGSDAKLLRENTMILKAAFDTTKDFFDDHDVDAAKKLAEDAKKQVETIERSGSRGQWDQVKAQAGDLGKMCGSCHGSYRERYDDGSFRAKVKGDNGF